MRLRLCLSIAVVVLCAFTRRLRWLVPRRLDPFRFGGRRAFARFLRRRRVARVVSAVPILPKTDPSILAPGALMNGHAPPKGQPLRASFCAAGGLVKKLERMINGENESVNDVKGRWARASWST